MALSVNTSSEYPESEVLLGIVSSVGATGHSWMLNWRNMAASARKILIKSLHKCVSIGHTAIR